MNFVIFLYLIFTWIFSNFSFRLTFSIFDSLHAICYYFLLRFQYVTVHIRSYNIFHLLSIFVQYWLFYVNVNFDHFFDTISIWFFELYFTFFSVLSQDSYCNTLFHIVFLICQHYLHIIFVLVTFFHCDFLIGFHLLTHLSFFFLWGGGML